MPDDVWLAITTQFSPHVTSHAKELRANFVKHDGQQNIVVENWTMPFAHWNVGIMAQKFIPLMREHMVDDDVYDWLAPEFSTTTKLDKAVASIVMMATMKEYFTYVLRGGCGFPSVTLQGEAAD
jgi:hypothetical protein